MKDGCRQDRTRSPFGTFENRHRDRELSPSLTSLHHERLKVFAVGLPVRSRLGGIDLSDLLHAFADEDIAEGAGQDHNGQNDRGLQ